MEFLIGPLSLLLESMFAYFRSRGSVMGFYINGLPSGPFVSMGYIWVLWTLTLILSSGPVLLPLRINERLKVFIRGIMGILSLSMTLAYIILQFCILFDYLTSINYLVADALKWSS